ncbi:hypothetical protein KKG55_06225 [Candidatus Micrarchaeota archaeon]|nr:hypothetical protein [Candidatus Micrarchaeota archaeon]MBU1887314.1 hypothetical protein [Candidatus Micrarchaeota archaeon]
MSLSFDESSYIVFVNLSNPSSEYIYGTYSFLPPVGYADPVDTIILLHPQEKLSNAYQLDQSFFVPGYYYVIPISTSFNDLEIQQSHNISVVEDNGFGDFGQMDPSGLPLQCQTVFILFAVCIISCFYKTR